MVGRIKTCFLLKNINVQKIIARYNLGADDSVPQASTNIQDISSGGAFFLDDAKSTHDVKFHTIDISGNNLTGLNCYWDKNPTIGGRGCPIDFVFSEKLNAIDTGFYSLKKKKDESENSTISTENIKKKMDKMGVESYYITDGNFCSLNCMAKFINEKANDPLYKKSKMLMYKMKKELFDNVSEIIPAPDWRELKEYGGKMTIEEFRNSFDSVEHLDKGIFICKSLVRAYEKKYKL
jgi:hypothetical protein